ncbi:Aminomethyltransferase folate-binding domain-containing protein [Pluteus cervinus]|uniref:Aminomethyltransferase folate-binding domain-containing protein n=1 Tax=Pluteus cervinus TaxID=181527 RepID=A0ACD3BE93_9AGAR|nr:Aminomethyltransferase folate-binding domain-containing protein [Pluteus cervinus]
MNPLAARNARQIVPRIARLTNRSVISVTGSQAPSFLNGVLAASVTEVKPFYSAILNAQGRVLHDLFAYTTTAEDGRRGFLLEFDNQQAEGTPLLTMLKRYVLRAKVKIRDVSGEYDVWAAWDDSKDASWDIERQWRWARSGAIEPMWDNSPEWPWGIGDGIIRDRRAIGMGRRLLVRKGDTPQEGSSSDPGNADDYLRHRLLTGIPEGSLDITPGHAFPMDCNLDVMGALDFRKGCYVGQELTVRTYHNGIVRKRILPVTIQDASNDVLSADLDIRPRVVSESSSRGPRPRGGGKLLSSHSGVGLALLRLEHVEATLRGDLVLELESPSGERRIVSPRWPAWWPKEVPSSS